MAAAGAKVKAADEVQAVAGDKAAEAKVKAEVAGKAVAVDREEMAKAGEDCNRKWQRRHGEDDCRCQLGLCGLGQWRQRGLSRL